MIKVTNVFSVQEDYLFGIITWFSLKLETVTDNITLDDTLFKTTAERIPLLNKQVENRNLIFIASRLQNEDIYLNLIKAHSQSELVHQFYNFDFH